MCLEKYALKLQYFSLILVLSLNCVKKSFVTYWLCLNVIYDATVGLHRGSATTVEVVLVP